MSLASSDSVEAARSRSAGKPIRVAVLGTQPLSRESLGALIAREADMEALSAADFDAAMRRGDAAPNVVVLDADLERDHGTIELVQETRRTWPDAQVLVVTPGCDASRVEQLMLAGACGVLTKDKPATQLAEAIRKVNAGEVWLGRSSMSRLLVRLAAHHSSARVDPERDRIGALTAREIDIVHCVSAGFSNKAIALRLGISDNTVRHHLTSIFAKLGVPDRLALAVYAMRRGLQPSSSE